MTQWPKPARKESLEKLENWMRMDDRTWVDTLVAAPFRETASAIRSKLEIIPSSQDWKYDSAAGIALYQVLDGLPESMAAEPTFWDWINIQVVPDLVCKRWSIKPDNWKKKNKYVRFISPRRNWCGSLWWCMHLIRQDGPDWLNRTKELASRMTVDDLIAIVERPGLHGYRTGLMRELMPCVSASRQAHPDPKLIRRVMLLHSIRTNACIPELHPGGLAGFAADLVRDAGGHI